MEEANHRTDQLTAYEPWLRLLARLEIDSRFQGKYSASDAVQQTLLEAWRNWDQFRGSGEQQRKAWLRQILACQLAQLARCYAGTQKRDIRREVSIEQSLGESSRRLDTLLPKSHPTPSEYVAAKERSLELAEALEALPEDYRTVILLRNIEELSHEEIAKRMDRSVGAVRMLWLRALASLKNQIEAE